MNLSCIEKLESNTIITDNDVTETICIQGQSQFYLHNLQYLKYKYLNCTFNISDIFDITDLDLSGIQVLNSDSTVHTTKHDVPITVYGFLRELLLCI